jgi:hypothetical protein
MQASITYNQTSKDIKRKAKNLKAKKIKQLKSKGGKQ